MSFVNTNHCNLLHLPHHSPRASLTTLSQTPLGPRCADLRSLIFSLSRPLLPLPDLAAYRLHKPRCSLLQPLLPIPPDLSAASRACCRFRTLLMPPELVTSSKPRCYPPPDLAADTSRPCYLLSELATLPELAVASRVWYQLQSSLPLRDLAAASRSCYLLRTLLPLPPDLAADTSDHYPTYLQGTEQTKP
jgi:hypothetical protein